MKLALASSNGSYANGTYHDEVKRLVIGDRVVAKNLCENQRENELITGQHILINIYKREYEGGGKVNSNSLK